MKYDSGALWIIGALSTVGVDGVTDSWYTIALVTAGDASVIDVGDADETRSNGDVCAEEHAARLNNPNDTATPTSAPRCLGSSGILDHPTALVLHATSRERVNTRQSSE